MSDCRFTSRHDAIQLDESLDADEVSRAWLVWSGASDCACRRLPVLWGSYPDQRYGSWVEECFVQGSQALDGTR